MMKKIIVNILLVIIVVNVFVSCSKDEEESVLLSDVIVGSWFAVSSEDESDRIVYSDFPAAITLTFRTDGTYMWVLSYTNSSTVPITYTGTYTYDDNAKTIKLTGKAYVGNYLLKQNDKWNVINLSKTNMKIWTDTKVSGIGVRTMVWTKN